MARVHKASRITDREWEQLRTWLQRDRLALLAAIKSAIDSDFLYEWNGRVEQCEAVLTEMTRLRRQAARRQKGRGR